MSGKNSLKKFKLNEDFNDSFNKKKKFKKSKNLNNIRASMDDFSEEKYSITNNNNNVEDI